MNTRRDRIYIVTKTNIKYFPCFSWHLSVLVAVKNYPAGLTIRPIKRIAPVFMSRIRNMKGRLIVNSIGGDGAEVSDTIAAVAAAASVPASSTDTNALWRTSLIKRLWLPSMPEKSAELEKAVGIPIWASNSLRLIESDL